jgi:hypothetical protein
VDRDNMKLFELYAEGAKRRITFMRLWGVVSILNVALVFAPGDSLGLRILHGVTAAAFAFGAWCEYDMGRFYEKMSAAHKARGT